MKHKKNFSNLFSEYSFLSPFGWSLRNRDYWGIIFNVSLWFSSAILVFLITYFSWIIESVPIGKVRLYLSAGTYLPLGAIIASLAIRFYTFNKNKKTERIESGPKLYYLRTVLFTKYFLLLLTIPLVFRIVQLLDIEILNELARFSREDIIDVLLRVF